MNLYEAKKFFNNMYPNKLVNFDFDENCYRVCECIMTDGLPNIMHHVECNKVKVTVDGMDVVYVPIKPHRFNIPWSQYKNYINSKNEVYAHPEDVNNLSNMKKNNPSSYEIALKEYMDLSGMSKDKIESKLKL